MFRSIERSALCAFWIGCLLSTGLSGIECYAQEISWSEKYYNPKPAEGDLVLPMPCGGAMVFRPAVISEECCLNDRRFLIGGNNDPELGYKEGSQWAYIAGAFTDEKNSSRRYYYISKYETTQDQYSLWQYGCIEQSCSKPTVKGRKPMVGISWFEAVEFARCYTEWLMENASGSLPKEDSEPGFLRLPTETEWEYAARGGEKVAQSKRLGPIFPLKNGELEDYIWSFQSAQGVVKPVGVKKPNPLGLYDILGNAFEMILVPFHLDHRGRPHGHAGGFVYRGGSVDTPEEKIRISERHEKPYYSNGKATKLSNVGFRLVLTAPVIVSHERRALLEEEWLKLPEPKTLDRSKLVTTALSAVGNVARQTDNEQLKTELEASKRDLEKAYSDINEIQERALKALIRSGAILAVKVDYDNRRVNNARKKNGLQIKWFNESLAKLEAMRAEMVKEENSAKRAELEKMLNKSEKSIEKARRLLEEAAAGLQRVQTQFETSANYYGDLVIDIFGDYPEKLLSKQLEGLKVEFEEKNSDYLIAYGRLFVNHIGGYRKEPGKVDPSRWIEEIVNLQREVKQ